MELGVVVAGVLSIGLGFGHMAVGLRWILPGLSAADLPSTPFGPARSSLAMLHVTWHIVTVFALGLGTLLIAFGVTETADPRTIALRVVGTTWIAATAMAFVISKPRVSEWRRIARMPVPLVWLLIGILCWAAA